MPQWYTRLEQCCAVYANVSLRRTLSVRSAVGDTAGNPLVRSLVLSTSAVVTTPAVAGGSGIGNGSSSAAIVGGTAARPGDDVIRATAVSVTDIDIDGVVQRLHTAFGKPPVLPPSLADLYARAERAFVSAVVHHVDCGVPFARVPWLPPAGGDADVSPPHVATSVARSVATHCQRLCRGFIQRCQHLRLLCALVADCVAAAAGGVDVAQQMTTGLADASDDAIAVMCDVMVSRRADTHSCLLLSQQCPAVNVCRR